MHVALVVAFGLIVGAPFLGRWRANVWLQSKGTEQRKGAVVITA